MKSVQKYIVTALGNGIEQDTSIHIAKVSLGSDIIYHITDYVCDSIRKNITEDASNKIKYLVTDYVFQTYILLVSLQSPIMIRYIYCRDPYCSLYAAVMVYIMYITYLYTILQ